MSNNEWEEGEIKLPSAEFAKLRQRLATAELKRKEALFAASQDFWKSLTGKQKSDPEAFRQAVYAYERAHERTSRSGYPFNNWTETTSSLPEGFAWLANKTERVQQEDGTWKSKPVRVLKDDMDFPTNRTTRFVTAEYDGSVTFDKARSVVVWHVSQNNHAVDAAHNDAMAVEFFKGLDDVAWTRNTGGHFYGNNEYNQDPGNGAGAGAHYVTVGFGPIGAQYHPHNTRAYRMADGTRVRTEDFPANKKAAAEEARWRKREAAKAQRKREAERAKLLAARSVAPSAGPQGRVAAGNSRGGEFTAKGQSAPEIHL